MSLHVHITPDLNDALRARKSLKSGKNEGNCKGAGRMASSPKHPIPIDFRGEQRWTSQLAN